MGSTHQDVEVSYGISNEFFELWLDDRMNYTCALYEDTKNFSDSLEAAQDNKLKRLSRFAGIGKHTESVLDIGCGWGANIEYQATVNKVPNVHGITLSTEQWKKCVSRDLPNTTALNEDFWKYEPSMKFDSVMSICMIEHMVTPEAARAGRAVDIYREYFKRAHSWTKPGTFFGLQAITRCNVPRNRQDLEDMRHSTYTIFPGAVTPRVEDLIMAVNPYYEVVEMHSMRDHYRATTAEWLARMRKHEGVIREKWGNQVFDDYDRYLRFCVKAFTENWMSLHQFSLRRLGN